MSGRRVGSGLPPLRSVGARTHWPEEMSAASVQPSVSQPFAAIQRAPGATPMSGVNGPGPSPPTIVPVTCVPCPTLSHGSGPQTPVGSHQLWSCSNPPAPRLPR